MCESTSREHCQRRNQAVFVIDSMAMHANRHALLNDDFRDRRSEAAESIVLFDRKNRL